MMRDQGWRRGGRFAAALGFNFRAEPEGGFSVEVSAWFWGPAVLLDLLLRTLIAWYTS